MIYIILPYSYLHHGGDMNEKYNKLNTDAKIKNKKSPCSMNGALHHHADFFLDSLSVIDLRK